jgi:elongation factor Ts
MSISMDQIKKLRAETGAGVLDAKKALEASDGDFDKATEWVKQKGLARADKKSDRETKEGYVASYVHTNGKVAAMVEVLCETDFVARNEDFRAMAKDVAMQVASMQPTDVEDLLKQDFIRGEGTIEELVKGMSGKIGEKLVIQRFVRYGVGEQAE